MRSHYPGHPLDRIGKDSISKSMVCSFDWLRDINGLESVFKQESWEFCGGYLLNRSKSLYSVVFDE